MPVIYLPFCPYLFVGIHKHEILKLYDIAYLTDIDMLDNRHKLYSATNSIHYELIANVFDLTMRDQGRYCSYSLQSVLQFEQNISMTDEEKKTLYKFVKM